MGPLFDAVRDLDDVTRLLKKRGPKRGAQERAAEIVALHYEVPLLRVQDYAKRGKTERHRLPELPTLEQMDLAMDLLTSGPTTVGHLTGGRTTVGEPARRPGGRKRRRHLPKIG